MTGAANGQRAPFDLDAAAKAAAAEAKAGPFTFTYKGETYEVPPAQDWPLEAQALIGEGGLDAAMPMLLGEGTYAKLVGAGMTLGELTVLFEAIGKDMSIGGLPNLPAPARPASTRT